MSDDLPGVVLTTVVSVDGRITLGRHERLLDPDVGARWSTMASGGAFGTRHEQLAAGYLQRLRDLRVGYFVVGAEVAPGWRATPSARGMPSTARSPRPTASPLPLRRRMATGRLPA